MMTATEERTVLDPETIVIDLGKKSPGRAVALYVAQDGLDGLWRYGYKVQTEDDAHQMLCARSNHGVELREEAIKAALRIVVKLFQKDKPVLAALEGFHAALGKPKGETEIHRGGTRSAAAMAPLPKGHFAELAVEMIFPNPDNARRVFDATALAELAESIKLHGLLQPVAVRRLQPGDFTEAPSRLGTINDFEIVLGERRWRAHGLLGRATIECKVYEGVTREQAKAAALVENLQRVDLNPIEEAEGYRDLMAAEELTQEGCAARVGRSRPAVANALRMLSLPAAIVELVRAGKLTPAHGVALARFKDYPAACAKIGELAVQEKTAAGELEKGLPFAEELVEAGLVVELSRDFAAKKDLPKELQKDGSVVAWKDRDFWSEQIFCLDVQKGTAALAVAGERKKELEAKQEASRGRTPEGKMTPAAKKERAAVVAKNKKNRAEVEEKLGASLAQLGGVAALNKELLLLVVEKALRMGGHYNELKAAAEKLGIKLPARIFSDYAVAYEKLAELSENDLVRLTAAAIALTEGAVALRIAAPVPGEITRILSATASQKPAKGKAKK